MAEVAEKRLSSKENVAAKPGPGSPNLSARRSHVSVTREMSAELLPDQVKAVEVQFESKHQLLKCLEEHKGETVDVHIDDLIDFVASMRGVNRSAMVQTAVTAWFYHGLGYPVKEIECHEQPRTDDSASGLLLFRVRLDGDHDYEVGRLQDGEDLAQKFRQALITALPGEHAVKQDEPQGDHMVQISWTRGGSIELGGVVALNCIVLVVMAIGVGYSRWDLCSSCTSYCSCLTRPGRPEGDEYAAAIRELQERGAEFEVSPDGTAKLRVPPNRDGKWRCPECVVL